MIFQRSNLPPTITRIFYGTKPMKDFSDISKNYDGRLADSSDCRGRGMYRFEGKRTVVAPLGGWVNVKPVEACRKTRFGALYRDSSLHPAARPLMGFATKTRLKARVFVALPILRGPTFTPRGAEFPGETRGRGRRVPAHRRRSQSGIRSSSRNHNCRRRISGRRTVAAWRVRSWRR